MLDLFLPIILAVSEPDASDADLKMCARVLKLQPRADPRWACSFATWLNHLATRYQMDPNISLAIAMQESSLNPDAVSETSDVGVFQFSPATIRQRHIDRNRLNDLGYVIDEHLRFLKEKQQRCRDRRGWSCYHSTTPHLRKRYEASVLKFY